MIALRFHPRLLDTLKGYDRATLGRDVSAGITVGVLALPLGMAFAIASGASPAAGIWTGIIAGFLVSALGGSRVQIGGPTGAFIPILYAITATHGLHNMLAATLMAGVFLVLMGVLRMGSLVRLIPVSVVIGFTNGIAVVIALSQVKDFFGMRGEALPAEFFERMQVLWHVLPTIDAASSGLALATVAMVLLWKRAQGWNPRLSLLPAQLIGLLGGSLLALAFAPDTVETIGSRFNGIPQGLPAMQLPLPDISRLGSLLAPALTIALLGAIESLLSARVVDAQIDDRHDPNQELLAQGLANIAAPFFGGIAATGAIARTSTNVRAGGRTPIAGIVHALVLLLIVLVAAPLAAWVPIPVLAAIVVITAVRMGEWHEFARLRSFPWSYALILMSTFLLTVLFDLTVAVEIGLVLACLFFIRRMQNFTELQRVDVNARGGVAVHALRGAVFFGAVGKLEEQLEQAREEAQVMVFDMSEVIQVDATGANWLHGVHRQLIKRGGELVLCGLSQHLHEYLARSGLLAVLGPHNACSSLQAALTRAREVLNESE